VVLRGERISNDPDLLDNIQAWVENDYDTRILHSNISFPLLKRLTNIGDPMARNVFKREIAERFSSGEKIVILFLLEGNYLEYLDESEKEILIESVKINFVKFKISEFEVFVDFFEEFYFDVGEYARNSFLMNNFNEISNFIAKQVSKSNFDHRELQTLYESLNRLMSFLIKYEKLFFDFAIAIYKIKKYFNTDADVEIRDDDTIYIQYNDHNFLTKTNFSNSFECFDVFLAFRNALFGNENIIFSNIQIINFDSLVVKVILCSKKVENIYSENFSNISNWIKYKNNAINQFANLDTADLDFTDKIHYIYLILWNLLCQCPKQTEMRFIRQSNFFFEIIKFYDTQNCDVKIDTYQIPSQEFLYQLSPILIIKERHQQFYRKYRDEELYNIIKPLFFRDENVIIDAVFWRKHLQVFEISVKFNSSEIKKKTLGE